MSNKKIKNFFFKKKIINYYNFANFLNKILIKNYIKKMFKYFFYIILAKKISCFQINMKSYVELFLINKNLPTALKYIVYVKYFLFYLFIDGALYNLFYRLSFNFYKKGFFNKNFLLS